MDLIERAREKLFGKIDNKPIELKSVNDQDQDDKDLVNEVQSKLGEIRENVSRVSHEGIWLTNIAYLLGFDSIFYDTSLRQFRPAQSFGNSLRRNRVNFNYILPNIQNRLSRLTKSPPRFDVRPNSTNDEDKEAARLAVHVITYIQDMQRLNKKRLSLMMWMQQCGYSFLKTSWDPTLGPKVPNPEDPDSVITLGDVRIDICSAFEIFVDPLAKSSEEMNYLIHAKIRPLSYFRTQYPERGFLVRSEDVWLQSLEYQNRINSFNAQVGSGTGTSQVVKDSAIEISYYEKPNYKSPRGRHVIVANGVLLKDDELPIDEIPFAKFDDVIVGGKYMSESVITHLRPLQDQFNRNLSKRSEWLNRTLMGKFMAARGHGLAREAFNDQSGEILEYDAVPNSPPPTAVNIPPIPQYAYNEDELLKQYMNEICGVSEVSKGQLPSASIPALGMQVLQESDDSRIGTITESNEHSYADNGRHILKFVEKYYKYPRLLKMAGKGMEYSVKSFVGDDLKGSTDAIVIRGSTVPGSKVLRRQEIINLHQQGYLGNPQDPQVLDNVLNLLEYGDIADVWKDHSLDMAQIKEHLKMLEENVKPPVSEFDNHPLFIKEFNRYRKSDKFGALTEEAQMLLIQTMEEHLSFATDMLAPDTSEPPDQDPNMQEAQAAQQNEEQVKQQITQEVNNEAPPEQVEG